MKVKFSLINGFTGGLNVVLKRNIKRCFSSVNLALSALHSSEDETSLLDDLNAFPTSSNRERVSIPCAGRSYVTSESRFLGSSVPKFVESNNDEMGVMMSILAMLGWNFRDLNCCGTQLNEESVINALNGLFNDSGKASISLYFFRWSEVSLGLKHTAKSICTLIHILVLGNMNYSVVDFLTSFVHGHPQHIQPEELVKLLQEISNRKVLETVYSMLVDCYTKNTMINEALEVICLTEEVGIFPSARVCNTLLKSLLDSNREEWAWNLLEKMQARGLVSSTIISLFIYYYCNKGNLECGWKLLMDMKNYGIKPGVGAYATFIHFLCKLSYLKEATSLVFKMVEIGISPDSVLLTSIIDGYCKVGKTGNAICIIKLFNVRPNVLVYNSFISNLCKFGDMNKASAVFHEMSGCEILPDCFIYTTMIDGYCKAKNIGKALQYFGRMLKDGIEPSMITYTILIDGHCRIAYMDAALLLLEKMIRRGLTPDIVVYNTLINGYKNNSQLQKAFELLGMLKSAGISPDVVTYNIFIHGLVIRGFVSEAKDMLDELIRRGFSPDVVTFTNVIGGYSNKGQFEEAFFIWSCMSDYKVSPDVITCSALINGYCRANRIDEARALFHKMLGIGLIPDLILYNNLILGFCKSGNIEEASHIINMMVGNNIFPNDVTYRALILGYEKKRVMNPVERAVYNVHQILQSHGYIYC